MGLICGALMWGLLDSSENLGGTKLKVTLDFFKRRECCVLNRGRLIENLIFLLIETILEPQLMLWKEKSYLMFKSNVLSLAPNYYGQ